MKNTFKTIISLLLALFILVLSTSCTSNRDKVEYLYGQKDIKINSNNVITPGDLYSWFGAFQITSEYDEDYGKTGSIGNVAFFIYNNSKIAKNKFYDIAQVAIRTHQKEMLYRVNNVVMICDLSKEKPDYIFKQFEIDYDKEIYKASSKKTYENEKCEKSVDSIITYFRDNGYNVNMIIETPKDDAKTGIEKRYFITKDYITYMQIEIYDLDYYNSFSSDDNVKMMNIVSSYLRTNYDYTYLLYGDNYIITSPAFEWIDIIEEI